MINFDLEMYAFGSAELDAERHGLEIKKSFPGLSTFNRALEGSRLNPCVGYGVVSMHLCFFFPSMGAYCPPAGRLRLENRSHPCLTSSRLNIDSTGSQQQSMSIINPRGLLLTDDIKNLSHIISQLSF